ncbi:Ankyrin [Plasmopara halstedii]|uniref:Ankyrin n=1 Tax=Plasmopara halstedii TaxID=4781 RepID=A0A0P1AGJ9_PLAHL|nr:Ankyrin [Plasmopara halstedii]CEG39710.1 Ankyrin [Plasmopara halstedii]|eukprot:XP_024576079.1 Ankyrin [Plasmopara halstedii]
MAPLDNEQVENAWLEAARNGDLDQMKSLRRQYPQQLDLNRNIQHLNSANNSQPSTGFCGWHGFHLSTIGASALYTATWFGDDKIIEYLLEEGQDPDTEDESGMSAITVAIMHHNLQATRCIFRNRVAIQQNLITDCRQEDEDRTRRTVARLELYLRFNANINKRCQRGKSALHYATTDDTFEVAKLLVCNGAIVDLQDEEGKSPLHHCIQAPSLMVANLLLQHGANVHLPDIDDITPLQRILRVNDINMLQIILNHHLEVVTLTGEDFAGAVLLMAVDEEAESIISFLLNERYTTLIHQDNCGETPMHRALRNKSTRIANLLRAIDIQGLSVTTMTKSRDSCLHYGAKYSTPEELKCLIKFYQRFNDDVGPINRVNVAGQTAIFLIATSKSHLLDDRDAKTRLMLTAGAKLLGNNPFVQSTQRQNIVLSTQVHTCLYIWLPECAATHSDDVSQFGTDLLAIVYSSPHSQFTLSHDVLGVMLAAGYAVDSIFLLLLLPFDRKTILALLDRLRLFGTQLNHMLLLALYEELAVASASLIS